MTLTISILIIGGIFLYLFKKGRTSWKESSGKIPASWRSILVKHVPFYRALEPDGKVSFELQTQEFLLNCRIVGIKTEVTEVDEILVAASAVIPIFSFPDWKYFNLKEVLLYPNAFDKDFNISGTDRKTLGMVGTGYMDGKMILSKRALHQGFQNESDKKNTAIHEFVHLIDKQDGSIDGIPEVLMQKQYLIPWIDLMEKKIQEIRQNESDINSYGATNHAEFLSVTSEYFFERPKLLKQKHPELYDYLCKAFQQDMTKFDLSKSKLTTGRNDLCPCQSGRKFKRCCGK